MVDSGTILRDLGWKEKIEQETSVGLFYGG